MTTPTANPPTSQAHLRRTRLVAATAILVGTAATVAVLRIPSTTTASADDPPPATAAQQQNAQEKLRYLADRITSEAADSATRSAYAYHHQRRWILDTTGTPAPPGVRANTPAAVAIEIRRWEANDGSGRGIDVEVGPDYTLPGADPDNRSIDAEFANGRTIRHDYAAGNARSPIARPLATDRVGLARQLAADPMPDGPQATLHAVDELYTSFYVDLSVHRAILLVLADLSGLTYRDGVTGPHRRGGQPHQRRCRVHTDLRPAQRSVAGIPRSEE